jgi:acyl-CoA synthetase (AMP-forming)/AMP-acid ligase II
METISHDVPIVCIEDDFEALEGFAPNAPLPDEPIDEDAACLILFTSGTTGRPKGAVVSHRAIIGFVKTQTFHGLERMMVAMRTSPPKEGEAPPPVAPCAMVTSPLFHLSGLYAVAIMMLVQGAKTVYRLGRFDPAEVMRIIQDEQVSIWSALGSAAPQVLAHPDFGRYDLSSLRNIGFGGAPTSPALMERLKAAIPHASGGLGMGYGLSESGGMGAAIGGVELDERPTSTGRAQLAHQIEIRDEEGKALPAGVDGHVFIRSPYLMLEYWRNPEATAETIHPGRWLDTGDVGRLDEDGYLYINSRARDMILRSGENVYPVEIEHRLDAHPKVRECAVIGEDHAELGQEVKAIVVPEPGESPTTEELAAWVGQTLARYKVPSSWEMRSSPLPRNPSGKVLKKVLTGEAVSELIEE